jgi:hypothetical protein
MVGKVGRRGLVGWTRRCDVGSSFSKSIIKRSQECSSTVKGEALRYGRERQGRVRCFPFKISNREGANKHATGRRRSPRRG